FKTSPRDKSLSSAILSLIFSSSVFINLNPQKSHSIFCIGNNAEQDGHSFIGASASFDVFFLSLNKVQTLSASQKFILGILFPKSKILNDFLIGVTLLPRPHI